jgi:serine/threonine-protein phosphatase 2A regulatory subunit B'
MKRIIHKLYQKVVKRRKHFRKMFNNQFLTLIYERPSGKGANEILDIYSSVISGFAVPLRTEHVDFFKHFLTPLLKMQSCSEFYEELLRCILIFLNKDKTLAEPLLKTVLEFWPYGNTTKEIGFLVTLYESMDYITELDNIELYIDPLFKRIAS